MLTALIALGLLMSPQAAVTSDCQTSEQCGDGMCQVWEHGRFVCEPRQYTMAVWDRSCLDTIAFKEDSHLEAPVDANGEPIMKQAVVVNTSTKLKRRCTYRLEVRSR